VARFNERFILSLGGCKHCLAMDDELNILPITDSVHAIKPVNLPQNEAPEPSPEPSPSPESCAPPFLPSLPPPQPYPITLGRHHV
jgi:tRNA(Met) C34 N-acetyltransferase TmcA